MKRKFKFEMKQEKEIGPETVLILPEYDEQGDLNSVMYQTDGMTKIGSSPYNLIDTNLRYRGSSMRGAMEGSQALLGKMNKNPIIIDKEQGIILLPSKSAFMEDCVWLSMQHIVGCVSVDLHHTQVLLSNGGSIVLPGRKATIDARMNKAYELQFKMNAQNRILARAEAIAGSAYHLIKNVDRMNYEQLALE